MSEIRANSITDAAGTGAPNFPNGLEVAGSALSGTATQAQAQAGTNNTTLMTPLRTAEAIAVLTPESPTPLSQRFKLAAIPSSTTYTVAAGKQACIIAVGGGGSGAQYSLSSVNDDRTCFGGNGGSAVRAIIKPSTSLTLTITIGAGGVSTGVSAGGVGTNGVAGSATTVTGTGVSISAAGGAGGTYHTAGTATGPTNGSSSGGDVFLSGSSSANTTDGLRFTSGTTPFGGGSQSITNTSVSGNMWYDIDRVGSVASGFTYISRASVSADRFADYPSQMLYARQMLITPFQGLTKSTEFVGDMPFDGMETPGLGIYTPDGNATGGTGGIGCGGGGALKGGGSSVTARGGTGGAGYVIILEEL